MKKKNSSKRKTFTGLVISDKMEKTVVVEVLRRKPHPRYRRVIQSRKKLYADNQAGAKSGDKVIVQETRPLSKMKRFTVLEIVKGEKKKQ